MLLCAKGDHSYGRRNILLFNIACLTVAMGLNVVVVGYGLPLWSSLPVALISGIGGNMGAFLATVFASVADISSKADRTACFSRLEGSIFLAGAVGSSLGGFLVARQAWWAYLASLALMLLALVCVYAFFDDAAVHSGDHKADKPCWKESMMQSLRLACDTTTRSNSWIRVSPGYVCLLFAIMYTAIIGAFSVFVNYIRLPMFGFSEAQAGLGDPA